MTVARHWHDLTDDNMCGDVMARAMAVPERSVPARKTVLPSSSLLASQVYKATVNGDKTVLNKLIVGTLALQDAEDQFASSPMYYVLADWLYCAESLLKARANVNKVDHSQRTALHLVAQKVSQTINC
ncbi:inversin-like [Acipenser ruthenus]|uniref:inversin-like n=1 Tax=Acipenser ruthenus TaxID=7906 RepID=UPI0027409150|nr:inversin-like [Acipenser ruthenus]